MGKTKSDWSDALARYVCDDINRSGISESQLVKRMGISTSTLNDVKNAKSRVRGPQAKTLSALIKQDFWSFRTRNAASVLLNFDDLAFNHKVPNTDDIRDREDGDKVSVVRHFAAE